MALTITTLIENSPGEHKGLAHEHGLSFHIVKDGHVLLFDSGQSGSFLDNARELRIDPSDVAHVVLSHGHYDHSGGLPHLAELTTRFELLVGAGFFREKYGDRDNAVEFLGNNFDKAFLQREGIRWRELSDPVTEIVPGVYAITDFERTHADEKVNPRFTLRTADGFEPDPFTDEVCLAIDTPKGLVVLLGCSHPGVKNLLDTVLKRLNRPIHAVMGGTHMVEADADSVAKSVDFFLAKDIQAIGVSHCTGEKAMCSLEKLEGRYFHNRTGSSLYID